MASRPTYQQFVRHTGEPVKREPLNCITTQADGVYMRDGGMNRDGHGPTPNPVKPDEGFGANGKTIKEVHVYHHKDGK